MAEALPAQRRYEEAGSGGGACGVEDEREEARKQTWLCRRRVRRTGGRGEAGRRGGGRGVVEDVSEELNHAAGVEFGSPACRNTKS
uniref:Uncharacterized protein n=1 Tax=Leersia perrieri TaxID=77586 RepID=A0A0D9UWU1_9ORYZ